MKITNFPARPRKGLRISYEQARKTTGDVLVDECQGFQSRSETRMFRKHLIVAVIGLCGLFAGSAAKAQEFPGLGVGDLWAANMAFDQQFDHWNRQMSWQVALATPNDQPLPFNAMTISNSITQGSNAALDYVRASQYNSNAALNAVERWDTGAVQGNWYYGNGNESYVLPYQYNTYHQNNGYIYGGYNPYGGNLYMMP
jgi:hypothetical protein